MPKTYSRSPRSSKRGPAKTPNGKKPSTSPETAKPKKKITKITPLQLDPPAISTEWYEEPQLLFADSSTHCDPKVGIPLYGPRSLGSGRHKREIHVGFIGTAEGIAQAQEYYADCAQGIDGDEEHAPFPGCSQDIGYRCDLRMDDNLVEAITRKESLDILSIRNSRERFEAMLGLLVNKMDLLTALKNRATNICWREWLP